MAKFDWARKEIEKQHILRAERYVDKIDLLLTGVSVTGNAAVDGDGKAANRRALCRSLQLGICHHVADQNYFVEACHDISMPFIVFADYSAVSSVAAGAAASGALSSLRVIERRMASLMPKRRSSSSGNSGALVKVTST